MKTRIVLSHAGKYSSMVGANERNDCTVVALANATGWSYDRCHEIAEKAGRKRGRGAYVGVVLSKAGLRYASSFTFQFDRLRESAARPTLAAVLRSLKGQPGPFIVCTSSHALAVRNGEAYDVFESGARQRIRVIYSIDPGSIVEAERRNTILKLRLNKGGKP